MQAGSLTPYSILPQKCYTIHFPSGFTLPMKIPTQITVYQLTEVVKNYAVLHSLHGVKIQGVKVEPRYLATLDNNVIVDLYLSEKDNIDKELAAIGNSEFRIIYGVIDSNGSLHGNGFCPAKRYQILGKIASKYNTQSNRLPNPQQIIARNRETGQLVSIREYKKQTLSFRETEQLLHLVSQSKSWQKQAYPMFTPIIDTFQTSESVCLVRKQLPFRLDRVTGYEKDVLDFVVYQIAKIVHQVVKKNQGRGVREICIEQFRMDFGFRVCYVTEVSKNNLEIGTSGQKGKNCGFSQKMVQLLESILRNCDVKIIELYIPLLHWLKNKRISNYLQFLKYVQIPNPLQDPKKKSLLQHILKSSPPSKLQPLHTQSQFQNSYKPLTSMFTSVGVEKNQGSTTNRSYHKESVKEIIENVSTVKKKKQELIVCTRPALDLRAQIKKNTKRLGEKNKGKNNKSFVQKKKKNKSREQRSFSKVSEFLIQD